MFLLAKLFAITGNNVEKAPLNSMKYRRCRPDKRIYRNLALGFIAFMILATVLPVMGS